MNNLKFKLTPSLATVLLIAAITVACGSASEPAAEEGESHPAAHVTGNEGTAAEASTPTMASAAPRFTLPSASGESVSLASFAGDKNVVLVFYRGFW